MTDILRNIDVKSLTDKYRDKTLSPLDVTKACLEKIESIKDLNAFCFIDKKTTLEQADNSEKRWQKGQPLSPVDGVPCTIKDTFLTKKWPRLEGSKIIDPDQNWDEDSPPVARLRESGAVFLGKTTTPEFGHKGVTDSPLMGTTYNPWDKTKTPGGSSGGAAVAAHQGTGLLHLGSDGGGSIRIPASFTGVFGFKPSQGLVPAYPPSPFSTIATAGPLTRTVRDAAIMMDIISKPDKRDWFSLPYQGWTLSEGLEEPLSNLKIGVIVRLNDYPVWPEIENKVRSASACFEEIGHLKEIELDIPNLTECFNNYWMAGAKLLLESLPEEKRELLDPDLVYWGKMGQEMALEKYLWAEMERINIGMQMQALFHDYDLIILPSTAMPAFNIGQASPRTLEGEKWESWTPNTYLANLAKLPAASIPCGFTSKGLPIGLQIMGGFLQDKSVLRAARHFEKRK